MNQHTDVTGPAEGSPRAYILEDDMAIASLEADVLRELGFSVITCSRIVELGDLMELALPHLLVVDVMLPDGDGGDITSLLRSAWPGIPVIIVSAASRERLDELRELGPVVSKPFDVDEFAAAAMQAVDAPRSIDGARDTAPGGDRGASARPVAEQVRAG